MEAPAAAAPPSSHIPSAQPILPICHDRPFTHPNSTRHMEVEGVAAQRWRRQTEEAVAEEVTTVTRSTTVITWSPVVSKATEGCIKVITATILPLTLITTLPP